MPLIFLLTKNTPRSNFKITSIMNEVEFQWRKQMVAILTKLIEDHPMSGAFVHSTADEPFFEDSVNFSNLRNDLCRMRDMFKDMNYFAAMAKED